jgi:pimeloyl-ACP methyl ester carboxylesterase
MSVETVVLVHGLWMNGMDMSLLSYRIGRHGYKIAHFRYHSMGHSPRESAARLQQRLRTIETPVVHFICHSLGGLVIRHLFYHYPAQKPGKVVTLGTPHKPSYCAYRISTFPFGHFVLGKSIEDGLLGNVPAWDTSHDLGSIAGRLRLGLGMLVPGVPRPNDGSVSVEETRMEKMKDHAIVNASHFGLLLSASTARLCLQFLKDGVFRSV